MKVAFYGPFRKGLELNNKLNKQEYLGQFTTEPKFNMFILKDGEPCISRNGRTSITLDVYNMKPGDISKIIDKQKGFIKLKANNNKFDKHIIESPYGKCYVYVISSSTEKLTPIIKGDWKEHQSQVKIKDYL